MSTHQKIDPLEARVVGVLVEKELTTPDNYPLSLNAMTAGCNQKSNRDPVMSMSEGEVLIVIEGLRAKGIVGASYPSGGRVERFHHSTREIWNLMPDGLAVITELWLRGPQTLSELRARAGRMHSFDSLDATRETITRLIEKGFARELSGGRAARYSQLLAPEAQPSAATSDSRTPTPTSHVSPQVSSSPPGSSPTPSGPALEARVARLEEELATLKARFEELAEGLL